MTNEMTIITYGGGEILFKLFTGIKMVFDSGFIKWMSYCMASITAVYVIYLSYFKPHPDHLTKNFLFPVLALVILCFNVKTTVYIEDCLPLSQGGINWTSGNRSQNTEHVAQPSRSVDGVPFIIGFLSKTISSLGYQMTLAVESVFHEVDDEKYSKTGMIFGAETALDMNEIVINDGNLDSNLRTFCRNCMLYDLALNLYTLKDLKNETNLLDFLKERTAKSRYMNYIDNSSEQTKLISCKEAIENISKKLEKGGPEVAHQQNKQIFRNLPIAYQALTKVSGDSEEIIKQLLVMSVVTEEMSSQAFASKRAALQQKTTWKTMGGIADGLVITTRCVIESLIYGAVLFVIPLLFLPSGFTYLKTWVWLLVWIQLWPPFYAILDYISLIAARGQSDGLFDSSRANTCCLSIYNTIGLSNVYGNISAYAKSMKILIPPLSYAILQGGVGSFVHLTSSMMGASQQAVSQASSDEMSGNYSFANASMDTKNFSNATYGQQNYASSTKSGFVSRESIGEKVDFSSDASVMQEKRTDLSHGFSVDESFRSSLAENLTTSQTAHESSARSLNESISNTGRDAKDFTSHVAHDLSYSTSDSTSESFEASKAAQFMENKADTFAKDHRLSSDASWEIFGSVGAGIPGTDVRMGISAKHGITSSDTWNDALSVSESTEYREAFNKVENFAKNFSQNSTDGEGERMATSFTQSVDQMRSDSMQYSTTLDNMNQSSHASSFYNDCSLSERQDLTQKFLDFAIDEKGYSINQFPNKIMEDSVASKELVQDFTSALIPKIEAPQDYIDPENFYRGSVESIENQSTITTSVSSERFGSMNMGGSVKNDVAEKLLVKQNHNNKFEDTRDLISEAKDLVHTKTVDKQPVSLRELDLEINWNQSFDDDVAPNYSYWWGK